MDVTRSSSPAPQVTDNVEDASHETVELAHHLSECYDRDSRKLSLQEILETTSTLMHFISTITTVFYEKGEQNSRFREELRKKILFSAVNVHAWASARVVREHTAARDSLEAGIQKLVEDERDQDHMRARLSEMFEAINNTVAKLAGLG